MPRRNVLIFHSGALGDFVVSWPLVMALSRLYPQSRILYVTAGSKGRLAEKAIRVEAVDVEAGWHGLFAEGGSLPETARAVLENAHLAVSFVANNLWLDNVKRIAPAAQVLTIEARPADGEAFEGHITQWIEKQLAVPAIKSAMGQILRSINLRGCGYKRSPEGTTYVHPGAGSQAKSWPAKHFVQLVRKLVKSRRHVRVILGEVEKERLAKEDLEHFAAVAEIVEPVDYVELLTHLGIADALVCNDTGPGHLAGIIGTPTFAIFGPESKAARWKPLGPHVKVKETEDLARLSAEDVFEWMAA